MGGDVVRRRHVHGRVDILRNVNSPASGCRLSRVDGASEFHAATPRVIGDVVGLIVNDVVGHVAEHVVRDVVPACERAMTRGRREDVNFGLGHSYVVL